MVYFILHYRRQELIDLCDSSDDEPADDTMFEHSSSSSSSSSSGEGGYRRVAAKYARSETGPVKPAAAASPTKKPGSAARCQTYAAADTKPDNSTTGPSRKPRGGGGIGKRTAAVEDYGVQPMPTGRGAGRGIGRNAPLPSPRRTRAAAAPLPAARRRPTPANRSNNGNSPNRSNNSNLNHSNNGGNVSGPSGGQYDSVSVPGKDMIYYSEGTPC